MKSNAVPVYESREFSDIEDYFFEENKETESEEDEISNKSEMEHEAHNGDAGNNILIRKKSNKKDIVNKASTSEFVANTDSLACYKIHLEKRKHQEIVRYAKILNMTFDEFICFLFDWQKDKLKEHIIKNL